MPILAWVGLSLIVGFFLTALTMKKPPGPKAVSLDDFDVPQVEEGTPHAVVFGDGWLEGWQVVWYGNYRSKKIKAKGGKKK
jgi:hypothetical protein